MERVAVGSMSNKLAQDIVPRAPVHGALRVLDQQKAHALGYDESPAKGLEAAVGSSFIGQGPHTLKSCERDRMEASLGTLRNNNIDPEKSHCIIAVC